MPNDKVMQYLRLSAVQDPALKEAYKTNKVENVQQYLAQTKPPLSEFAKFYKIASLPVADLATCRTDIETEPLEVDGLAIRIRMNKAHCSTRSGAPVVDAEGESAIGADLAGASRQVLLSQLHRRAIAVRHPLKCTGPYRTRNVLSDNDLVGGAVGMTAVKRPASWITGSTNASFATYARWLEAHQSVRSTQCAFPRLTVGEGAKPGP